MKTEQMRWKQPAALAALSVLWILPSASRAQAVVAAAGQTQVPSMLQEAAQPPSIQLVNGQLMIQATNSSLRTILDDLQQRTGTKVEGLSGDERIFGVYGPGNPQEVLAAVLDDSGYNVLIAGRNPDGSPRSVVLSTRTAAASAATAGGKTQAADEAEDEGEEAQPRYVPPPPPPAPAAAAPAPSGSTPQPVKTPQQMLEELQRMRLGAATASGAAPAPPQ